MRVFGPRVVVEMLVGALVFAPSALILAPQQSRDLLRLVRGAAQRRRGGGEEAGAPAAAAAGEP
jgi:hypothetical protein